MGGEEALPSPADLADLRGCCGTGVLKGRLRRRPREGDNLGRSVSYPTEYDFEYQ